MKNRSNYNKRVRQLIICFIMLILVLSFSAPIYATDNADKKTEIKVGFFKWDGYHEMNSKGVKSGYGYDFLKMMQNYNNWTYDYVGYDKSWADMLEMLDNGKIDLVTSAQKTPEWEAKYDYSDNHIGTSSTILSVKASNTKYVIGDTSTYDGMRVGLLTNSSRNEKFDAFAKKNNFKYKAVYFSSLEELVTELDKGNKIDAVLSTNLRPVNDETILEEFDPVDYYIIVKKGNIELLSKINNAISQMDLNAPGWRNTLKEKYYSNKNNETIALSKDELSYINNLEEKDTVFVIATNPDIAPYSYFENGKAKGIAPRIFKEIAKKLGIKYKFESFENYKEYNKFVKAGKADIDLTCFSDYGLGEYHGIELSDYYMSTSLAMLSLDSYKGKIKSIAQLKESGNTTTYTEDLFDSSKVKINTYETNEDCIEAIKDGKDSIGYFYTYTAQKAVEEDVRNKLTYTIMPEYSVDLCFGMNDKLDYRLMSVINKGIKSVKGHFVQDVIQDETSKISENYSVVALIYDYPAVSMIIIAALLIFVILIIVFVFKYKNREKEHRQALELSRFMGYVCESNEVVMEVDLDSMICTKHNMVDGELINEEVPYKFAEYRNDNDNIHPDDFKKLINETQVKEFKDIFNDERKFKYFEARAKDKNGEYCWYSYTVRAIPKDKNHKNSFILFKKNIDSVKQEEEKQKQLLEDALETARSASVAKGQFLSKMSHEIRTPLNAVIGYMDIAHDSKGNESKIMHCVENSSLAAKHLLNIINDVLDISSIESGKLKIANEEFDLKEELSSITTIFFNQAKAKNLKFDVIINELTEEWIIGDSLRLNQILMNLLSNSIKFTDENGSISLTISQLNKDSERVYLQFEVADTGIGMSEEYLTKIFMPFEQATATTAKKFGGSGLGLSITHNLVNMMGGKIKVDSKEGKGTKFTVSLHFDVSKNEHNTSAVLQDFSKIRALIVDDEKSNLDYMKGLMKRCKIKCDTVSNGQDAIKQVMRRKDTDYKYDLCLIDWNMPDMNGVDVAKEIKTNCDPNIPIIIATAYDVTNFEDEALGAGVSKVVAKPLFQSTVFDLLVSTFGKYVPIEEEKIDKIHLNGLNILLAEDNEMNMEIAVDILKKSGINITPATNGQEAFDIFLGSEIGFFDAILMDIQMPILNGYEATEKIRSSSHGDAKNIPIIAMTANAFAEDITEALARGMNDHIAKPIDYDKLFTCLYKYRKKGN